MNSSFFHFTRFSFVFFFLILFFFSLLIAPIYSYYPALFGKADEDFIFSDDSTSFLWPIPGYTKITSPFGKRTSPTAGASSFHKGTDIGAPEGTPLYAICDGTITFCDFLGGGGYTITLSCDSMKITYCHVGIPFLVWVGEEVKKGQHIANVGPKNVYGVANNPYKDKNGNPTNGATTGCHLHLGVRIQDQYVNPMSLFDD